MAANKVKRIMRERLLRIIRGHDPLHRIASNRIASSRFEMGNSGLEVL